MLCQGGQNLIKVLRQKVRDACFSFVFGAGELCGNVSKLRKPCLARVQKLSKDRLKYDKLAG
eukprot:m.27441 g.27441  ORF g.27441 m.27441 type:complete len:62 (+) comp15748_c0_seq1:511-696(+)